MRMFASKAVAVADHMVKLGLDPAQVKTGPFINLIEQLLQGLLPQLLKCIPAPTPAKVHASLTNLSWFHEIFLHREIRRALGTPRANRAMAAQLQTAVQAVAKLTTVAETASLMAEAVEA